MSELEFVQPLCNLVPDSRIVHYTTIIPHDIEQAEKIIISGTALADFDYLRADFSWLNNFTKPVLGICAGAQLIARAFAWELVDETTIGVKPLTITTDNVLVNSDFTAYFLHTKGIRGTFVTLAKLRETPVLFKHPSREIYGSVFHPEVLNPELITAFLNIKHK